MNRSDATPEPAGSGSALSRLMVVVEQYPMVPLHKTGAAVAAAVLAAEQRREPGGAAATVIAVEPETL